MRVYDLGNSSPPLQGCDERLELVYLAFDRMCNIKEFRCDGLVDGRLMRVPCFRDGPKVMLRTLTSRLPQALRAMIRVCIPVVIPVFVGPFWCEALLQWVRQWSLCGQQQ